MLEDLKYAAKVVRCLFSKYVELQQPCVGNDNRWSWKTAVDETPYHVCPVFSNHSHIPLPLFIDSRGCGPIQRLALRLAHYCANSTPFFAEYKNAENACYKYWNGWSE